MAHEIEMTMDLEQIYLELERADLPEGWFTSKQYHAERQKHGYTGSMSSTQSFLKQAWRDGKLERAKFPIPPKWSPRLIYWPARKESED